MGVKIEKFTFNPFQENTYLVHDGAVGVIIDPGCYDRSEVNQLISRIEELNIIIQGVLLTHAHIDHVLGAQSMCSTYHVPLTLHEIETETLGAVKNYAAIYGFPGYIEPNCDFNLLSGNENIEFGEIKFKVLFTPGHCVGHVVYYLEEEKSVINGDVLFQGSFGRVDLPGGDLETLKNSIYNVMFKLPDDTTIYCGHGPETTIGVEKITNYIHQF